jgi:hypothetical protein
MKLKMRHTIAAILLIANLGAPITVAAGPLEDARAAYGKGDYATALRLLSRLSRYEATLWRQVRQILFALDALDRRKPQDRERRFHFGSRQELPVYEREEC